MREECAFDERGAAQGGAGAVKSFSKENLRENMKMRA
jgi:hypothetical protein